MGKFSRSWQLVKQSFAILRSDKQLMLFPVLSAVSCLIVTAMIATGGAFLMLPARAAALAAGERFNPNQSPMFLLGMFTLYVVNYFVIVFFNVALVGVANSRLVGGTWTFRDGIELAWERKGTIFQWALVAATVGVILRTLEERMGLIGRIIMRIIGIAWTLACYFVVPVLAFEDLTPIQAVKRSSKLFRDTWGEKSSVASASAWSPWFSCCRHRFVARCHVSGRHHGPDHRHRLDGSLLPRALGFHVRGGRHLQRGALSLRLLQAGAAGF
jgi:hypothetical protein